LSYLAFLDTAFSFSYPYHSGKHKLLFNRTVGNLFLSAHNIANFVVVKMPGITKDEDHFQTLVQALSEKLGPSSGIDSSDVDETELQQLMEDYVSDETEWAKYFFPAPTMAYTRNLVDKGNGKSNLVLLAPQLI
jgi:hypothetical protein